MKRVNIYCFILMIIAFCQCTKENDNSRKSNNQIKKVVITSRDYVNTNVYESISQFDYFYENGKILEILKEGKKHITFKYENQNIIEKKYFNNNQDLTNIETFIYDSSNMLMLINLHNNLGDLVQSKEIFYDLNRLFKLKETIFFPTTSFQEYEFKYSGFNIDSIVFTTANQVYKCDYFEDTNNLNLKWFIEYMGQYGVGNFGINGTTLPTIFSSNSIKSLIGFDMSGNLTFEYLFDHSSSDGNYTELNFQWYNQNQEILNSTKIEFKY